jgi:ATP-dependent RNA helicase DDX5/DBP2
MENRGNKILIFTGTKRIADEITRFLRQDGWPALCKFTFHCDSQTFANRLLSYSRRQATTGKRLGLERVQDGQEPNHGGY